MEADEAAGRVSRGELVSIASQKTYMARLPKEVVETVDTALRINDSILPVHRLLIVSSSAVLRDLLSSQASNSRGSQDLVQELPLIDDEQDDVEAALACMYQRILLSTGAPALACITTAVVLVDSGRKYGVQVLLDEIDAYISNWCKTNLDKPENGHVSREQLAVHAVQQAVHWIEFAEGASLRLTLVACESWLVQHVGEFGRHIGEDQLSGILAKISSGVLARVLSAVAKKNGRACVTFAEV